MAMRTFQSAHGRSSIGGLQSSTVPHPVIPVPGVGAAVASSLGHSIGSLAGAVLDPNNRLRAAEADKYRQGVDVEAQKRESTHQLSAMIAGLADATPDNVARALPQIQAQAIESGVDPKHVNEMILSLVTSQHPDDAKSVAAAMIANGATPTKDTVFGLADRDRVRGDDYQQGKDIEGLKQAGDTDRNNATIREKQYEFDKKPVDVADTTTVYPGRANDPRFPNGGPLRGPKAAAQNSIVSGLVDGGVDDMGVPTGQSQSADTRRVAGVLEQEQDPSKVKAQKPQGIADVNKLPLIDEEINAQLGLHAPPGGAKGAPLVYGPSNVATDTDPAALTAARNEAEKRMLADPNAPAGQTISDVIGGLVDQSGGVHNNIFPNEPRHIHLRKPSQPSNPITPDAPLPSSASTDAQRESGPNGSATGAPRTDAAAPKQPDGPPAGSVQPYGGKQYRFKGGDYTDRNNWEEVTGPVA